MKRVFIAVGVVCAFTAPIVYAQTPLSLSLQSTVVIVTPEVPAPGQTVNLEVKSYSLNLSAASITWRADGKVISAGIGNTSASFTASALGTQTTITVDVVGVDGSEKGSVTIRPASVYILWESDSYVPPFYRGRALPSAGTKIKAQAIARFVRADGSVVPPQQIIYTWKKNSDSINGASGAGKDSATFDSPMLFANDTVSVDASSIDGAFVASGSTVISSREPILELYQNNPVYGILSGEPLLENTVLPVETATFSAIPFFAEAKDAADPNLIYAWSVAGKNIPTDPKDPRSLTIQATNAGAYGVIELSLSHFKNMFEYAERSWNILFTSAGSPAGDLFHIKQ